MVESVLLVEPFYGGSHRQLIDLLDANIPGCMCITMTAKKWHWRARTAALYLSQTIPRKSTFRILFCSSVLNLAELLALRPDLSVLKKIMYFHENQLQYPVQIGKERDIQYGYNQILSCLVADLLLFNSSFNMESFVGSIGQFLKKIPDYRPKDLVTAITPKCHILYFPIQFPHIIKENAKSNSNDILHIVWPHRWEHDKNPTLFFNVLLEIAASGYDFKLSVLGESYEEKPEIFVEAKERLKDKILNWGFIDSKDVYNKLLQSANVVVSTAEHEFFGVAMLEATYNGCYPICPNKLVYPEIFPAECLYSTEKQLLKMIRHFCKHPQLAVQKRQHLSIDFSKYLWQNLKSKYEQIFQF